MEKDHVQISLAQVQGWTRLACYAYGGMKKSLVERKETMGESPGMHRSGNIHFKTYLPLFVVVLFEPLGNVLVGKGMKSVGALNSWAPAALLDFFWRAFTTATIWLGIASLLTFFVAYMVVLSWADYSFVQPASAVSYGIVALLSFFLLHEVVKPLQRHGVSIISCGVLIVGNTAPRTTKRN